MMSTSKSQVIMTRLISNDLILLDFGLAKSTEDSGGLKTYCGTPQYFAPEVMDRQNIFAAGDSTYSLSADMWSVGVILYVLLRYRKTCASTFHLTVYL